MDFDGIVLWPSIGRDEQGWLGNRWPEMGSARQAGWMLGLLVGIVVVMPVILGDTITPFLVLGCWQLLIGNALIGVIEAAVVARFGSGARKTPIWTMIGANYFSMLFGWAVLQGLAPFSRCGCWEMCRSGICGG